MKIKQTSNIEHRTLNSERVHGSLDSAFDVERSMLDVRCFRSSHHPSPARGVGTPNSERGMALVVTLIMLSVTLIMSVAFLAISRRERNAVTTTTDTAHASSGVTMGYISGLAYGTDGFIAVGGATNKMVLVEAIFSPSVSVAPPSSPQITGVGATRTALSITAMNGSAGGSWLLLQSTNLALPLRQWQTDCAGTFDGNGQLSTNLVNIATDSQQFYILKVQ